MVIDEYGGPEKIHFKEVEKPKPLPGEVLIKVAYAGVNPIDGKIREGRIQQRMPHELPIILGWDAAGTVVELGPNVHELKIGDEVFAYAKKPLVKWGTYAEFVAFDAKHVVKKPKGLTLAQAAALPLVSLTAWQSLFDAAHLKKGETLLILAGSGGVGSMAIQFAEYIGATVIVTASPKKFDYVKNLGADFAVDYTGDFVAEVMDIFPQGVDVVFDCAGGEAFKKSLNCLRKGGRIVSLLEKLDPASAQDLGIVAIYYLVSPNGKQLRQIAELIEEKIVLPLPTEEMALKDASSAQQKLHSGAVLGKIVLKVS